MATPYSSNFHETIPFSDTTVNFNLATNVAQSYVIPGTDNIKYQLLISFNLTSNIFVGYNVSPTSPAAGMNNVGSNVEYRPQYKRYVKGGDTIYFITPDASSYVGISLRQIPG